MDTNSTLPFELTLAALASWLEELSRLPPGQAAHQLNEALKQIKAEKCVNAALLPLLINLAPLTLHLSNSLSNTASNESKPTDKTLKIGKLSMQLPRQLALLFCQLAESKTLDSNTLPTAIYYALQLIGYSLRCYSLFYEIPSATLWKKTAVLYKLAVTNQCLKHNQTNRLIEFKAQGSIDSTIKRNLLFSILNPNLYKTEEINQLFQLANQADNLLVITTDHETHNFGFYWDMDKDMPPYPVKKINRALPEGFMAIDSQPISNALQLGALSTNLSPSNQNKLALILSSYHQVFSSILPGLPSSSKLIHGFASACQYLHELNKLSRISQLSAQLPAGADNSLLNLSLVPLEHQRNVFDRSNQPFSKPENIGILVNMLKTPINKYLVAENRFLNCSTGDIALIYKEQYPISLSIIRQQKFNDISNSHQFLLELIPGACNIFSLANNQEDAYAIVVGENTPEPQVFLAYGKYTINSNLPLSIGKSIHLTACLEKNTLFERFRFTFTDN